ncbi:protein of unknown function [Clostridium beijerinckii]|nr:protein of unknown function [Clostridium beijerinckii]
MNLWYFLCLKYYTILKKCVAVNSYNVLLKLNNTMFTKYVIVVSNDAIHRIYEYCTSINNYEYI